jgi:hypothetical protein
LETTSAQSLSRATTCPPNGSAPFDIWVTVAVVQSAHCRIGPAALDASTNADVASATAALVAPSSDFSSDVTVLPGLAPRL